jgi:hypothetical protein
MTLTARQNSPKINTKFIPKYRAIKRKHRNDMTHTQDFKETVAARASADPAFARTLLEEAALLYLQGEANAAKSTLHMLVSATIGYECLAAQIAKPRRSLQHMLSRSGRLTMRNLAAIFQTLKEGQHIHQQPKSMRPA